MRGHCKYCGGFLFGLEEKIQVGVGGGRGSSRQGVLERVRSGYKHRLLREGRGMRKARVWIINLKIFKVVLVTFKNESASRVFIFLHEGVMWRDGGSGGWIEGEGCCSTSGV